MKHNSIIRSCLTGLTILFVLLGSGGSAITEGAKDSMSANDSMGAESSQGVNGSNSSNESVGTTDNMTGSDLARVEVHITCQDQTDVIIAEVAATHETRAMGLMHRTHLDPDAGMLFVYRQEQQLAMWMKNTLIELDMMFINREGIVMNIRHQAQPMSTEIIRSKGRAVAVLEVLGGTANRLGWQSGCRVTAQQISN